jgi:hypothetical protein
MSGGGINTHFVFLTCDDVVRRERLFNRDIVGSPARQLTEARLNGEDRDVLRTIEEILINKDRFPNVDFDIIDTNEHMSFKKVNAQHVNVDCIDTNEVEGIVPDFTNLKTMMRLNDALSNMTLGCMGLSTTDLFKETCEIDEAPIWNRGVEWSRRFALRAIDELKELLDEFPDEWWRKDKVDVRAARVELIDALHFIFSAANAMGMTPEMVCKTYYQKRAVNVKRQASGYTKRLKIPGDDLMIGSVLNPWTGADIGQPIPVRVDETDVAGQDIRSTKTEGSVQ